MPTNDSENNFRLIRDRILSADGPRYWRSLDEFAETPEFREFVAREYPDHAEHWDDPVGRRTFLKLMGASLALAGVSACVYQPAEKSVPFVRHPEEMVPGKPLYYASAFTMGPSATGLLVKSNEGRPTKIEGNPDHSTSLGATDLFAQASLLTLYDPDRSQSIVYRDQERTWSAFAGAMSTELDNQKPKQGAGLRFLTETVISPTLANQFKAILAEFPQAKWHQFEPAASDSARAGAMIAFGSPANTIYKLAQADRILTIDADILNGVGDNVRLTREFTARRRVGHGDHDKSEMNRLYSVESTPTLTGAKADHRLMMKPSEVEGFARALASALGVPGVQAQAKVEHAKWIAALKKDLEAHSGKSVVIAGDHASPAIHALAHAMNAQLKNIGATVVYTDPIEANPVDQFQSLRELVDDIDAGKVEALIIVGGNPVYGAPADLDFAKKLMTVKLRAHFSLYKDETSELCHWHVPAAHYLESWGDARAKDGTVTITQPLIEPLYGNKSIHEFVAVFQRQFDKKPYDVLREYWKGAGDRGPGTGEPKPQSVTLSPQPTATPPASPGAASFESWWRKSVHDGVIQNTAFAAKTFSLKPDWASQVSASPASTAGPQTPSPSPQFEIVYRPDPTVYDGRFANNGWLQELPKPLTKLTWDNAALVSQNTISSMGLATERIAYKGGEKVADVIEITSEGRTVRAPVIVMPGQPDGVITVHLGYGRKRAGRVGNDRGFNVNAIRSSMSPWAGTSVQVKPTGETMELAFTQLHFQMENRDIVREKTLTEYLKESAIPKHQEHERQEEISMYPPFDYTKQDYAWGMSIDVSSCVGCSACVVACQSENNIPVVGKTEVLRSREMHWLRIDSYFKGDSTNPEGPVFMPVPCMHCENAPCEPVCPVHATVHSAEGLNDMVYNRCVGTRYCSNNCPYKVRHFNFLLYQDWETPTYQLMRNPEVTVRSRGVMEKCTYCVQRIQGAKIQAQLEDRPVRDGDIVTACQSVCPAEAIVFGNINDPNSRVSKHKAEHRNYTLLDDLNTRPRTSYLAGLRNPNSELAEA